MLGLIQRMHIHSGGILTISFHEERMMALSSKLSSTLSGVGWYSKLMSTWDGTGRVPARVIISKATHAVS